MISGSAENKPPDGHDRDAAPDVETCQAPAPSQALPLSGSPLAGKSDKVSLREFHVRSPERNQTRGEELANSLSHGAGMVASIVATPFLIVRAVELGDAGFIVGASIFAATMILLYSASTLYHALRPGRLKHIFRIIEHCAIFLLIAGTYTPFTLGILHGAWGWSLFGMIWGLAAIGVLLKIVSGATRPIAFTILYLLMGWLIVIAAKPFYTHLPASGLLWLIAGGLSYTAGVVFFTTDSRLRYGHFIWHLFVMAGTTCHYFAVLWYAA